MKQALYKAGGNILLAWNALKELLLDNEVVLNNRPLSYAEDDMQLLVLTPNAPSSIDPNTFLHQITELSKTIDIEKYF